MRAPHWEVLEPWREWWVWRNTGTSSCPWSLPEGSASLVHSRWDHSWTCTPVNKDRQIDRETDTHTHIYTTVHYYTTPTIINIRSTSYHWKWVFSAEEEEWPYVHACMHVWGAGGDTHHRLSGMWSEAFPLYIIDNKECCYCKQESTIQS